MGRKAGLCLALFLGLASAARAQVVDQKQVDAAIEKGVAWLKNAPSPGSHNGVRNCDEIILLTMAVGGLPEDDPKFQEILKRVLEAPLDRTYLVSLQAMCLEEINRVRYQNRIAQCALFLLDNQGRNGCWSYGTPTPANTFEPDNSVATGGSKGAEGGLKEFEAPAPEGGNKFFQRPKPKVTRKIMVKPTREGASDGDSSNSQYAALGLRACFDSGINFPREVALQAKQWWMTTAFKPEKIDLKNEPVRQDVITGKGGEAIPTAPPVGWCYHRSAICARQNPHAPSGGMTGGAVGALCIYDYILGVKWKTDVYVVGGVNWFANNFTVAGNPGPTEVNGSHPSSWFLYYLYALERVGMLYDIRMIGGHDWYAEGATYLLGVQNGDGSWFKSNAQESEWEPGSNPTYDTCFAILFLKRATRKFVDVATGGTPVPNK